MLSMLAIMHETLMERKNFRHLKCSRSHVGLNYYKKTSIYPMLESHVINHMTSVHEPSFRRKPESSASGCLIKPGMTSSCETVNLATDDTEH